MELIVKLAEFTFVLKLGGFLSTPSKITFPHLIANHKYDLRDCWTIPLNAWIMVAHISTLLGQRYLVLLISYYYVVTSNLVALFALG